MTVVNGTRVTVAFPFSQIKLQEPAEETKELVAIVADHLLRRCHELGCSNPPSGRKIPAEHTARA